MSSIALFKTSGFNLTRALGKGALLLLCTTALAACQTTSSSTPQTISEGDAIDNALKQAAITAAVQGDKEKSLAIVERLYRRNSTDPELALLYSQALRKEGRLTRAALVIQPHATAVNINAEHKPTLLTEYAAVLAAMGDYEKAEYYARQAVLAAPELGRPYHILGLALDAQGHHPEAEIALRKAIDRWQGDPTPVLNNLGLNLAAQGFLDQAVEILRKAQSAAPNREEIERNLRIVSALNSRPPKEGWSFMPKTVIPERKPDIDPTLVPDIEPTRTEFHLQDGVEKQNIILEENVVIVPAVPPTKPGAHKEGVLVEVDDINEPQGND